MVDIGVQPHGCPCVGCAAGFDATTKFSPIHAEENHGLHAQRLDDVQRHREIGSIAMSVLARLRNVLRPESKCHRFADKRLVAIYPVGRYRQD